jgi:DNA-binding NarL/FixJ family response regulator
LKPLDTFDNCSLIGNEAKDPVLSVWLVDNQLGFHKAVGTALDETGDILLSGCFVHPEDVLLGSRDSKPPDVILIDIHQFGVAAVEALRQFRKTFPEAALIDLTESVEEELIWAAVCAGISGFVLKTSAPPKIAEAIRDVVSEGAVLSPAIAHRVLGLVRRLSGVRSEHGLTSRELSILDLMGQGFLMKEIAEQLAISYHTVDTHSRNIYAKLGVRSRTAAVAKALREQII